MMWFNRKYTELPATALSTMPCDVNGTSEWFVTVHVKDDVMLHKGDQFVLTLHTLVTAAHES